MGPKGKETLSQLFAGQQSATSSTTSCTNPTWEEGCRHLLVLGRQLQWHRRSLRRSRVTLRCRLPKRGSEQLETFQKRMGWSFKWVSGVDNDFGRDYHVSFTPEEMRKGEMLYNYRLGPPSRGERGGPGLSVFYKNPQGKPVPHLLLLFARASTW